MSLIDHHRAAPLGSISAFRVVSLIERAIDAFAAWRNAAATERVLAKLSDRQLADIGLHRGDIGVIAGGLAGR